MRGGFVDFEVGFRQVQVQQVLRAGQMERAVGLAVETDVPLWPGSNLIQVFAREGNEVQSVETLMVLARPGQGVSQK